MSYKSLSNYIRALLGYLIIGLLFPWLWLQGIYLKKVVLRLPTPADAPFGVLQEVVAGNSKFWDSENLQWQE